MQTNELNGWIYRTLAENGDYLTFDQIDRMLERETKDWTDALRRSYLRGELGRMIRNGSVIRDKNAARYRISDEVGLFQTGE